MTSPMPADERATLREIAQNLAQTIADHAQFYCTRCERYGDACKCETPPHDRARDATAKSLLQALKEADRRAREDAARIAEEWVRRATPFPRYYRYHNECSRAHDEQIDGLGDAIRASITTDEGE